MSERINISLLIPVYNEEKSIKTLYSELVRSINSSKLIGQFEFVFVDDGSSDQSSVIIKSLPDENIKLLVFNSNRGKSAALREGVKICSYETVVTLDADLQDVPSEIDKLLLCKLDGYNIVSGYKKDRKDNFLTVLNSKVLNFLLTLFYGTKIQDVNSGYKVFDKDLFQNINLIEGFHRFIPLFYLSRGYTYKEVAVFHRPRYHGSSKYSFLKVFPSFIDLIAVLVITKRRREVLYISLLTCVVVLSLCSLAFFLTGSIQTVLFIVLGFLLLVSLIYRKHNKFVNHE